MSEQTPIPQERTEIDASDIGGLRAPPGLSRLGKLWWWFDFLVLVNLARLRFVAILTAIGLLIVYWDTILAHYEKWTRPTGSMSAAAASGVEYFCPMHPQFVTADPKAKCPICGMNLSRRSKSALEPSAPLPAGIVARVQLSPYRVVSAGVRTWPVGYEKLRKSIDAVGSVEFDERRLRRITARVSGKSRIERLHVNVTGQNVSQGDPLAELYSPDVLVTAQNLRDAHRNGNADLERLARERLLLWGIDATEIDDILRTGRPITRVTMRSPISGHVIRKYQTEGEYVEEGALLYDVADLSTVWVEAQVYEDDMAFLREGLPIAATARAWPQEKFPGTIALVDPHLDTTTRTVRVRFDVANPAHRLRPGMYVTVTIDVPASLVGQRFDVQGDRVLAVPEGAVVDTGRQRLVYREDSIGVYDAVAVELGPALSGPRDESFYPVTRGLVAGDKVVTTGSYLLDAETRVSAAAGSIYYGGGGAGGKASASGVSTTRPSTPADRERDLQAALEQLSSADRRLAEFQKYCPVRQTRLGSMGAPFKIILKGQPVLLCCQGCETEARDHPEATLATRARLAARAASERAQP